MAVPTGKRPKVRNNTNKNKTAPPPKHTPTTPLKAGKKQQAKYIRRFAVFVIDRVGFVIDRVGGGGQRRGPRFQPRVAQGRVVVNRRGPHVGELARVVRLRVLVLPGASVKYGRGKLHETARARQLNPI